MKRARLKGGSLSGTYLCDPGVGPRFVRKDVSLSTDREYGFQRWYSQLKRLQRYSVLFPGIFPEVLAYGKDNGVAYFDLEYIEGSLTVHEYLSRTTDRLSVKAVFDRLVTAMDSVHRTRMRSSPMAMELYFFEEVEQRIQACMGNSKFREFVGQPFLRFNGEKVPSLISRLDAFKKAAIASYEETNETFTHGNLTLENVLYVPETGRVVFIDPYEENVIDSPLAEYSQVLQSCNSKYELYNAGTPEIDGDSVEMRLAPCEGLEMFNRLFQGFLAERLSSRQREAVWLLEITQFVRMLPFKMSIDESKMLFFYALASSSFHQFEKRLDGARGQ